MLFLIRSEQWEESYKRPSQVTTADSESRWVKHMARGVCSGPSFITGVTF